MGGAVTAAAAVAVVVVVLVVVVVVVICLPPSVCFLLRLFACLSLCLSYMDDTEKPELQLSSGPHLHAGCRCSSGEENCLHSQRATCVLRCRGSLLAAAACLASRNTFVLGAEQGNCGPKEGARAYGCCCQYWDVVKFCTISAATPNTLRTTETLTVDPIPQTKP